MVAVAERGVKDNSEMVCPDLVDDDAIHGWRDPKEEEQLGEGKGVVFELRFQVCTFILM